MTEPGNKHLHILVKPTASIKSAASLAIRGDPSGDLLRHLNLTFYLVPSFRPLTALPDWHSEHRNLKRAPAQNAKPYSSTLSAAERSRAAFGAGAQRHFVPGPCSYAKKQCTRLAGFLCQKQVGKQ